MTPFYRHRIRTTTSRSERCQRVTGSRLSSVSGGRSRRRAACSPSSVGTCQSAGYGQPARMVMGTAISGSARVRQTVSKRISSPMKSRTARSRMACISTISVDGRYAFARVTSSLSPTERTSLEARRFRLRTSLRPHAPVGILTTWSSPVVSGDARFVFVRHGSLGIVPTQRSTGNTQGHGRERGGA